MTRYEMKNRRIDVDPKTAPTLGLMLWLAIASVLVLVFLIVMMVTPAEAQSSLSEATSGSEATVIANQNAAASASQDASTSSTVILNQAAAEQRGETTLRTAPGVSAPSMGSGHPCVVPYSAGLSVIGLGVTGGAGTVDDACMLAQMGLQDPAVYMIAARNPSACRALRDTGRISPASDCGDRPTTGGGVQQSDNTATPAPTTAGTISSMNAPNGGTIDCVRSNTGRLVQIRVSPGVDPDVARDYCGR